MTIYGNVTTSKYTTTFKHTTIKAINTLYLFILACAAADAALAKEPKFITMSTGGATGVYYPVGGAICRAINQQRKQTGLRCSIEKTAGSIDNLNSLRRGESDLGFSQSDSQYYAFNGKNIFESIGPNQRLRSALSLYTEPFTVVASKRSNIVEFDDLLGKRVNIGNVGSGQRNTMEMLMLAKGWTKDVFATATELTSTELSNALCGNQIDAFVFSVGHPAGALKEVANNCDIVIVTVDDAIIDKLIKDNSFYTKATVPGGTYRGSNKDITTLGVHASLMASSSTEPETIYLLVKSIVENIESMKLMHPILNSISAASLAKRNPSIPMHEGATRYFREAGLLQ